MWYYNDELDRVGHCGARDGEIAIIRYSILLGEGVYTDMDIVEGKAKLLGII